MYFEKNILILIVFSLSGQPYALDIPTPFEERPPPAQRLISVPVSVLSDYPQSPAERYIAIRARMLYEVNAQQPTSPFGVSIPSQTPITAPVSTQQLQH